MPSPVFHTLSGCAFDGSNSFDQPILHFIWIMWCVNAPDIDLLCGLLFGDSIFAYHRLYSHSLIGCGLVFLFLKWVGGKNVFIQREINFAAGLVLLHLIADMFTGPHYGLYPSYGLRLFYPFASVKFSLPLTLFTPVHCVKKHPIPPWHIIMSYLLEFIGGIILLKIISPRKCFGFKMP